MRKTDQLGKVMLLAEDLESKGLTPILVGGMALVLLGSQRVTKDFDFLISRQDSMMEEVVNAFYKHGFELISKFNEQREVLRTIGNPKIANIRLKLDAPDSAFFFNKNLRLKIDLLIDFPLSAKELAGRADRIKIRSHSLLLASREDLIRLKEIAYADRKSASDAHDLEFLRKITTSKK